MCAPNLCLDLADIKETQASFLLTIIHLSIFISLNQVHHVDLHAKTDTLLKEQIEEYDR